MRSDTVDGFTEVFAEGDGCYSATPGATVRDSVFGGQLLGQALAAAHWERPAGRWPVSLLSHFVSAPRPGEPIRYSVALGEADARTYAWRRVVATQAERLVGHTTVAFSRHRPPEIRRDPPATRPDPCRSPRRPQGRPGPGDYDDRISLGLFDVLWVDGAPPERLDRGDTAVDLWLRPRGTPQWTERSVASSLALVSDLAMLSAPLLGLGEYDDGSGTTHGISLDHALRFYSPVQALDDWFLVRHRTSVLDSTIVETATTVVTSDGRLVLTASQQGLVLRG